MKKIVLLLMTMCIFACGNSKEENEENTKLSPKNVKTSVNSTVKNSDKFSDHKNTEANIKKIDITKISDLNKDGSIDGYDWKKLSNQEKINLVAYYNDLTYQSLGLMPSKEIKIKEGKQMLSKLNSFYTKSDNSERDVYSIMVSTK